MKAHIEVGVHPLPHDYDEGDIVTVVEQGKEFRMMLVENAFKGERRIKVVPTEEVKQ